MQHFLCLKTCDRSLKIDGEWPDEFIQMHGDNFVCEIEVYFTAEEAKETIDCQKGSWSRRLIDCINIEEICIYIDGKDLTGFAKKLMQMQVTQVLNHKPEILMEFAYGEINPDNQIFDDWKPSNQYLL